MQLLLAWGTDLTVSASGHELMSILVAFLIATTLSSTLGTYYDLQGYLQAMNEAAVEIGQLACSFTVDSGTNAADEANFQNWRYEVSFHAALLLKATAGILHKGGVHDIRKMPEFEKDPLLLYLPDDYDSHRNMDRDAALDKLHTRCTFPKELYVLGHNLKSDLNLRVPIRASQRLQRAIMKHRRLSTPLTEMQEMQLMDRLQAFMQGYRGCRKHETAPTPLPLVQLGRIFIFAYVFSLPFALLDKKLEFKDIQYIILVFLISYGFLGCELLFVELDDPFAEDPNDLPLIEEARAAVDDIIISLEFADGKEAAVRLLNALSPIDSLTIYEEQLKQNQPLVSLRQKLSMSIRGAMSTRGAKETDPLL